MALIDLLPWRPRRAREQCIALAGLYQSVTQVQACARGGVPSDAAAMDAVLESVLRIDAPSAEAVYGGVPALAGGLDSLCGHLRRGPSALGLEQSRYAASLMYLERRLHAAPVSAARLGEGIGALVSERDDRAVSDPWMLGRLAALYVDHVSGLGPRIMVSGEPVHLKTPANADRIRALLLSGLRACVLWRQCGGGRAILLFHRATLGREAAALQAAAR